MREKYHIRNRLAAACAPMYHHHKRLMEYIDGGWLRQMDTEEYPYVDEEEMRRAVRRFSFFCKKIAEWGFNGLVLGEPLHLVTLDVLNIYRSDSPFRIRAEKYRDFYRQMMEAAEKYSLKWFFYADEYFYNCEIEDWLGKKCFANLKFWMFYQEKYRELLKAFPTIAGVVLRYGEVREYAGYKSLSFKHDFCECEYCRKQDFASRLNLLLANTLEVIGKEFPGEVIFRTWQPGGDTLHNNPELCRDTFKTFSDNEISLSFKTTKTDFWFYQPLNPCIGSIDKKQMVEFDCMRDYEGRGLFPCVRAKWWADTIKQISLCENVESVWIWPCESGNPN